MTGPPVIRCRGVAKRFGAVRAIEQLDLEVQRGQLLSLLGPSGCGKTTALRLIAGFEAPDEGTIELDGQVVAGGGVFVPPERRRVGMVFQDYALFPHLTVAENVAFGLRGGPRQSARVRQLLELVGLSDCADRWPHQLSGGQQQRVALARALAPEPTVILLDEPFSNLDAALRARVRSEVREILARAGATAIFVTHDQAEALSLADQVAVLWGGRLLQVGSPEEVYRQPATPEIAAFVGDMDSLPGEAEDGWVACELGRLASRGPATGPVEVFIPPEAVQVEPAEDGEAEIVWREFFGHDQRLTIRLGSGRLIHARLDAVHALRPGQRVHLRVRGPVSAFLATTLPHPGDASPAARHVGANA